MRRLLLIITTLVFIAAACSTGSSDLSTSGRSIDAEAPAVEPSGGDVALDADGGFAGEEAVDQSAATDLTLQPIGTLGREIIKTGRVETLVDDVSASVNEVTVATEARSGIVFGRTVSLDGERPSAGVVVKVPATSFDQLMDDLAKIGEVQAQESSAEDVTDQIVDIESRLTSARASVERVRGFLEQATNVDELTRVEAELTRRESDLEALEGRLAALEDQTTLSTITISLATDPADIVNPDEENDKTGFAAGFAAGRDAFIGTARGVLAVVGFALPFVPVVALVAAVIWLVARLRGRGDRRSVVGAEA
ncbi:MAG TPA: DUF4349 domain-containing protein [Acidimicrobiales bacterium]|nr:DUF4349 domain-containing protein [Acidimicrobiales bacterium]